MGQKCGELHAASLLRMRRVMKCLGMLPICQNLFAKVFCNVDPCDYSGLLEFLALQL